MNRYFSFFFRFFLCTLFLILSPTRGQEPQISSNLAQGLTDIKRQADKNKKKIDELEPQLAHKTSEGSCKVSV